MQRLPLLYMYIATREQMRRKAASDNPKKIGNFVNMQTSQGNQLYHPILFSPKCRGISKLVCIILKMKKNYEIFSLASHI